MKDNFLQLLKKHPYANMAVLSLIVIGVCFSVFSSGVGEQEVNNNTENVTTEQVVYQNIYHNFMVQNVEYAKRERETIDPYFTLTVNEELTLAFRTKEELELALEIVQQESVGAMFESSVDVIVSKEGAMVETEVEKKYPLASSINEINLSTSGQTEMLSEVIKENIGNEEAVESITEDLTDEKEVELIFNENVEITEVDVDSADELEAVEFVGAVEGASILNKTNVAPEEYIVESGDSPYSIAADFDMSLSDLYDINEGLEEKATGLQVGDAVVVEVLEPELSVIVEEEITYFDLVERGVNYVNDNTIYLTVEKEGDPGSDGTKEVTAIIQTMNGKEVSREIISEKVIIEPVNSVILVGTKELPETGPVGTFEIPLKSYIITSPFGSRWGSFHNGVDLAADYGTTIYSSDGGTVTVAGWSGGYGYMVEIDHGDGRMTRYAHCSEVLVSVGLEVGQGDPIAKLGNSGNSTGPHLHFEIILDGDHVNPMSYVN